MKARAVRGVEMVKKGQGEWKGRLERMGSERSTK